MSLVSAGVVADFAELGSHQPGLTLLFPQQSRDGTTATVPTDPVDIVLTLRLGEDLVPRVAQL